MHADLMEKKKIEEFLSGNGGVMSVTELAALLGADVGLVRRWARENGCRRVGSTFVFAKDTAVSCAKDIPAELKHGKLGQRSS